MDPTVYAAAMEGEREILINRIDQLDQERTPYNSNILHILSQYGQAECVSELLEKMDSSALSMLLPAKNRKKETALHVAAREGHPLIITALIKRAKELDIEDPEKGLNILQQILTSDNKDGDTALHEALRTSIVSPQMDGEEATPGLRRNKYRFPTLKRIITGYSKEDSSRRQVIEATFLDDVTMLMFPDFPYAANKAGETPLYLAAECGCNQLVSKIANDATCIEPAAADYGGPGGRTALHAAIISDNKEIAETLNKWCNDLATQPDMRGWTPLHYAAEFGYVERVKQLLGFNKSLGYQMTGEEDGKNTAIHIAARQGHVALLEELVSQCAGCWDVVNAKGQNMLHVAIESDKPEVITFFKQSPSLGSLLNRKDIDGNTPIQLAARDSRVLRYFSNKDNSKVITFFEQSSSLGSLLNQKDIDGNTPLQLAAQDSRVLRYFSNKDNSTHQKASLKNENQGPLDQLAYCGNGSTEQKKATRERLIKAGVLQVPQNSVAISGKQTKDQTSEGRLDDSESEEPLRKYMERVRPTQLVLAVLVATASFAAGMSMPGGYNAKEGSHQGVALLLRQTAFQGFVVTNALAMIMSTSATLFYLVSSVKYDDETAWEQFVMAVSANLLSLCLMMVAFITGSYALLAHLPSLAITMCVMTAISSTLLLMALDDLSIPLYGRSDTSSSCP